MSDVKMLVRIIISMLLLCNIVTGQTLNRRQQAIIQRQQKQLDQQQETLEKQLFSEVFKLENFSIHSMPVMLKASFQAIVSSTNQNQQPINYAILDSIFNVSHRFESLQ